MSGHQTATVDDTVYFWFAANDTSGSGGDGATPLFDVREAGAAASAIPLLSGTPTLLTHANFPPGLHEIAVAATIANGFAADDTFAVFCTLLIDSQNPSGFVGSCTLTPLAKASDLATALAELDDIQTRLPAALVGGAMDSDVSAMQAGSIASGVISAAELTNIENEIWDALKSGHVVANSFGDFLDTEVSGRQPSGAVDLNADQSGVTIGAVTGAVGSVTGAVGSVTADVTIDAGSVDLIWDETLTAHATVDSAAVHLKDILDDTGEIGAAGAGLTAINLPDQVMNITGDITGNLSGNVGGNVVGSVGSLVGHTNQTGDNFTRLGAPAGASVSSDIADVQSDTDNIQTRLPSALVGGKMDSDTTAISGSTIAADNLREGSKALATGAVVGTPTTTVVGTDLTETTNDHYVGRIITFNSGNLAEQASNITAYNGTTKELTVTALTEAPSASDTFVIS